MNAHLIPDDSRTVSELEAAGSQLWQLTLHNYSDVDWHLDRDGVFAKGFTQEVDRRIKLVGIRIGIKPDHVVARFGDHVIRHPDGLALDLEDYFTYVIETIADDETLLAQFLELVDDRSMARGRDGWESEKLLMEKLVGGVGCEVRVRGEALRKLGERLLSAVPKPKPTAGNVVSIPAQREGEAAA